MPARRESMSGHCGARQITCDDHMSASDVVDEGQWRRVLLSDAGCIVCFSPTSYAFRINPSLAMHVS